MTPLNHSYASFVARCDTRNVGDLQGQRDDAESRVGRVHVVATRADGPSVVSYVPRHNHSHGGVSRGRARERRDPSGTRHCVQPRVAYVKTPEGKMVYTGNSCLQRNVLLIRVNFLDASVSYCNEACVRAAMWAPAGSSNRRAANEMFKASSYGQTEFDEAASDVITVTVNEKMATIYARDCPTDKIAGVAESLARTAGHTVDDYQHRVFFMPTRFGRCEFKGQGEIPGRHAWVRATSDVWETLGHELGHNLGLNHAGTDKNDNGVCACACLCVVCGGAGLCCCRLQTAVATRPSWPPNPARSTSRVAALLILVCWCAGVLVCWCAGAGAGAAVDWAGVNEVEYGDGVGVMGTGWTFNAPSRLALGWIADGHGLLRYDPMPSCTRVRVSALDHTPSNGTHANPHGTTMVSFPRTSREDRYFVSFYALGDLYGSTVYTSGKRPPGVAQPGARPRLRRQGPLCRCRRCLRAPRRQAPRQ